MDIEMRKSIGRNVKDMESMTTLSKDGSIKVKYIASYETPALDRNKVYTVMSIEKGWYRIMTELDEDYLFPPEAFEIIV